MRRKVTRRARYVAWVAPLALVAAAVAAGCTASVGTTPGGGMGSSNGATSSGGSGGSSGAASSGASSSGASGSGGSSGSGAAACVPLAASLAGDTTIAAGTPPLTRRLWRLSTQQWSNSIKDVLGLAQAPALSGNLDYSFFSDDSAVVDPALQFTIWQATQTVMTQIASQIPQMAACTTGEAPQACAQRFAQTLGAKAFRRPLDPTEVTALMAPYTAGATQDFNTGISLMIQALVQSPSFLHRTELGPSTLVADASGKYPDTALAPYEVASQLSYLFTDTIPDKPLLDAAANGSLATDQGISAQIDRLLALPAVKQNIDRIMVDWFNVRQLFSKTKDPGYFTSLAAADQDQTLIENDLYTSTRMFVDDVLWSPSGKVSDLLLSQKVWVNQRLGQLYGLSANPPAGQFIPVNDPNRSGML
ncbi:MAG: DUF1592 domain-containing protein, partial [Myxococcota bacterium]|nr:DUF1592 domain-containing protein [Myxococcota bacterium]